MGQNKISYQSLFRQASVSCLVINADGGIIDRNDFFLKNFPAAGNNLKSYFPDEFHSILSKLMDEATEGKSSELEITNPFDQDSISCFRLNLIPLKNQSSQLILVHIIDISDSKKTENKLIQAANEWRRIFDSILNPICLTGPDGIIVRSNTSFAELLQLNFSQIVNKNFLGWFPELKDNASKLEGENFKRLEKDVHWRDHDFKVTINPYSMDNESGTGIIYIFQDITRQRKAEYELSDAEFRVSGILDSMVNPVYFKDTQGIYRGCNRAFCEFVGYPKEQIIGKTLAAIAAPEFLPFYFEKDAEIINHGGKQVYETQIIHADGTMHDVIFHKSVIMGLDGKPQGIVGAIIDISDRKKVENFVKANLEEKEVLLKEIHHRVKNNLNIISSLLSLKNKGVVGIEAQEVLSESISRIRSMALIHEKLYQSDNLSKIKISEYIENLSSAMIANYKTQLPIDMKIVCDEIFLNINQMIPFGLMLNEMMTNSIKYAFKNKTQAQGIISISVRWDGPGWIKIDYFDDGEGIPESFDFEKPKTLGIQIIKDLTRQLEGKVELIREKGAYYTIRFPYQESPV